MMIKSEVYSKGKDASEIFDLEKNKIKINQVRNRFKKIVGCEQFHFTILINKKMKLGVLGL